MLLKENELQRQVMEMDDIHYYKFSMLDDDSVTKVVFNIIAISG